MISGICITVIIYLNIISREINFPPPSREEADTALINKRNNDLLLSSRRNPDMVIPLAHQVLKESENINYTRGKADAYMVLGSAWFAKSFNNTDSSEYYSTQAYELYRDLDYTLGKQGHVTTFHISSA